MSATTAYPGDDLTIVTGKPGQEIKLGGWETVQVTRSAEVFPNSFMLTMTEAQADPNHLLVEPGLPCRVYIGTTLVITGFIDRYAAAITARSHDVTITGRGRCQDLLDCSADLLSPTSPVFGGSTQAKNALALAQKLCDPWHILARCAVSDLGLPIKIMQVALGDTPYQIIERVALYAGYLVYEDELGQLVLDRVATPSTDLVPANVRQQAILAAAAGGSGTVVDVEVESPAANTMASGFTQGVNVEAASASLSVHERFSSLTVVWSTVDALREGTDLSFTNQRGHSTDPGISSELGRFRPRIEVSAQSDGSTLDFAQRTADWEVTRRRGRSQMVQLTCDTWRDEENTLWTPNRLVMVDLPALKVLKAQLIIATVVFRKDQSGTHAELTLMPAEAFAVKPGILQAFDRELGAQQSQSPPAPQPPIGPAGLFGSRV
jgi:prophage tail gpP-like protein